jgi:hypothetical protein
MAAKLKNIVESDVKHHKPKTKCILTFQVDLGTEPTHAIPAPVIYNFKELFLFVA